MELKFKSKLESTEAFNLFLSFFLLLLLLLLINSFNDYNILLFIKVYIIII
jgi:hypothetical protein